MAAAAPDQTDRLDLNEQIARIEKTQAEIQKLFAETTKIKIDTRIMPFTTLATVAGGGAAFFAAGATFIKLLG